MIVIRRTLDAIALKTKEGIWKQELEIEANKNYYLKCGKRNHPIDSYPKPSKTVKVWRKKEIQGEAIKSNKNPTKLTTKEEVTIQVEYLVDGEALNTNQAQQSSKAKALIDKNQEGSLNPSNPPQKESESLPSDKK